MGEKKGKRKISEITNKAMKRVKRGILTAGTILFVGGALVGTTFSNNAQSVKESVMEHFRNKQRSATTTSATARRTRSLPRLSTSRRISSSSLPTPALSRSSTWTATSTSESTWRSLRCWLRSSARSW